MIELYGLLSPQALSSLRRSRAGKKLCEEKKKGEKKKWSNFECDKFIQWVSHIMCYHQNVI